MSKPLWERISRLVSGQVNSLVEMAEDATADAVMAQAIKEVDEAITDAKTEAGRVAAQIHQLTKRSQAEQARHEELGRQSQTALDHGREDLARAAIAQQLAIEAQRPESEQKLAEAREKQSALTQAIKGLQARRAEMQVALAEYKVAVADRQSSSVPAHGGQPSNDSGVVKGQNACQLFDDIMSRVTGAPPATTADGSAAQALSELADLERDTEVSARLQALKQAQNA